MPFTLSHAAAVLPFSRPLARWQVLSAAVIGSMVPDFRVFMPWHLQRFETHSAVSLFTFSLPLGLSVYWLFQYLIKVPMIEVLPDGAYARWHAHQSPAPIRSTSQWLLAGCGVLGGAFTHLVWDAFTHEGARGVRMLPMLDEPIFGVGHHHMLFARALQDISSLAGLLAVLAMLCYGLRRGAEAAVPNRLIPSRERSVWSLIYALAAGIFTAAFYIWAKLGQPPTHSMIMRVSGMAVASLRGLAAALLFVSLALDLRLRALHHRSSGSDL